ncbi:hypothetical protein ElyMa_005202600 [Elysia marginata]|uniref:MANSC domain-containing protein n=1 Tax=Elysia marginata TaxID=1093978 RepID=A0AAV4JZT7_9GAST|nr:hypothetical protein ElyMa_005202600 [Elysia marginata]
MAADGLTGPVSQSSAVKPTLPMDVITSYVIVAEAQVIRGHMSSRIDKVGDHFCVDTMSCIDKVGDGFCVDTLSCIDKVGDHFCLFKHRSAIDSRSFFSSRSRHRKSHSDFFGPHVLGMFVE